MNEYEQHLRSFMKLTADMRTAQQEYFKRISVAKKSRNSDDFASAKRALMLSKELEAECDTAIRKGIKPSEQ